MKPRICMHVLSPAIGDARVMREASALAEAGYDVSIVDIEHDSKRPDVEIVDGVRVHHTFVSPKGVRHYSPVSTLPWLWFKITRIARSARNVIATKADAYHAHDITALPACLTAAALRRKPLVFDSHELPMTQRHLLDRPLINRVSQAALRWMIRRCSQVITVSPQIVTEIQTRYGGPAGRLVRNVPDYTEPVQSNKFREYFNLPADSHVALYQGYFQENRSLDVLVRAAQLLPPNVVIVLMGKGEKQAEIEALIAELGVGDRVKIKGYVPHAELLSWTASADVGLSAFSPDHSVSIRYCLPNKVFEYLMAGVPILTTPLEAIVDLVQRYGVGRIIPEMTPAAIAKAIVDAVSDPGELARMRANALAACKQELRWNVEAEQLVNLYRDVFRGRPQVGVPGVSARA